MATYGEDPKRTLLEFSELEPEDSFLYTSYYNTVQRTNRQTLAEVSEWVPSATKADDVLIAKRKRPH